MAGKIFIRERREVAQGEKKPRFVVVGTAGADLKIFTKHLRKMEIEQIAQMIGAELIILDAGKDDEEAEVGEEDD
ncbi:MAG: hypothetical protein PHG75_03225 [Syntrophomonas sp.]|nr:hypothetical protein [Syntrophomonas sp.]